VQSFDDHRSTVVPWLRETGIVDHLRGLKKDEIRAAITLPSSDDDGYLRVIINANQALLRVAHQSCFDGPDCMLTWPCRVVLNRFQSSQVLSMGTTRAFDPCKEPGSLDAYFRLAQQVLAYFDRVAASDDYFFSSERGEESTMVENTVEPTDEHMTLWQTIRTLARKRANGEADEDNHQLQDHLLQFWIALISHETAARRFESPLLSCCSMLGKVMSPEMTDPGLQSAYSSKRMYANQTTPRRSTLTHWVRHECMLP
jgi:hypothetical protein